LFVGAWLAAFALGDADIGLFQHAALLFRYSMMLVLVVLGLGKLTQEIGRRRLDVLQVLALSYLAIQILHLFVDGPSVEALLILPMQAAAGLGLVIGCRDLVSSDKSLLKLGRVLAWAGILLTLVALSSLVLRTAPFLGGRFRGWHDLSTGFATGYVMFLVPLVWAVLGGGRGLLRLCSAVTVVIGIGLIAMSGTRNALLCLFAAVFTMLLFWRRRYILPFLGVALIITLIAEYGDFVASVLGVGGERVVEFRSGEALASQKARFSIWSRAWELIGDRAFWGYGLVTDLRVFDPSILKVLDFNAHSAYLGTWLRLGLIGLLLVLATYAVALIRGISVIRRYVREGRDPGIAVLFVCVLLTIVLGGFFEDNLAGRGSVQQAMLSVVVVALVVISSLQAERPRRNSLH
jgi:O-antigen ligase